jgi:hypothetical protein
MSSLRQFSMVFTVSMHLQHHTPISGIIAIHMASLSLALKSGRPLSRNPSTPFHHHQIPTSPFEITLPSMMSHPSQRHMQS